MSVPVRDFPEDVPEWFEELQTQLDQLHNYIIYLGSPGRPPLDHLTEVTCAARRAYNTATTLQRILNNYIRDCQQRCPHTFELTDHYADAGDGRTIYSYRCTVCAETGSSWGSLQCPYP